MALRNVPYAAQTAPTMGELDQTFADVAALGIIPSTAAGTNAITLTPTANTPTVSAYANYQAFSFVAAATATGAVTIQVGSLAALNVYLPDGVVQASANNLFITATYVVVFNSALNGAGGGVSLGGQPYFEGTWTPALGGSSSNGTVTYTQQTGNYILKGNEVTFWGRVTISAVSASPTGNAQIQGLPFAASNIAGLRPPVRFSRWTQISLTSASFTEFAGEIIQNTATITLLNNGSAQ